MWLNHWNIDFTAHAGLKSNSEIKNQMKAEKSMDYLSYIVDFSSKWVNTVWKMMAFVRVRPELDKEYQIINSYSEADKRWILDIFKNHDLW